MGAAATAKVLPFRAEPEVLRDLVETEYSAARAAKLAAEAQERRAQLVDELATMRSRELRSGAARHAAALRDAALMSPEQVKQAIETVGVSRTRFWELAHQHGFALRTVGARPRILRQAFETWLLTR